MKVQQAPSPVQALLVAPEIVAPVIAQSMTGGGVSQAKARTIRVRSVFAGELKRLRRAQSSARPPPPPSSRSNPPLGAAAEGNSAVMAAPPPGRKATLEVSKDRGACARP